MSLPVPAQLYTVATTVLSRLVVLIVPVVVRSDSDRVSESWGSVTDGTTSVSISSTSCNLRGSRCSRRAGGTRHRLTLPVARDAPWGGSKGRLGMEATGGST